MINGVGMNYRIAIVIVLLLAGSAAGQEFPPTAAELAATSEYLYSREEQRRYLTLETDSAREAFWQAFWRRQDPTPETDFNEMLDLFRSRMADTGYFDSIEFENDGWQTDRGRMYIIYGAPGEIYKSHHNAELLGEKLKEVWVYTVNIDGVDSRLEIVFEENENTGALEVQTPVIWSRELSLLPRLPAVDFTIEFR